MCMLWVKILEDNVLVLFLFMGIKRIWGLKGLFKIVVLYYGLLLKKLGKYLKTL